MTKKKTATAKPTSPKLYSFDDHPEHKAQLKPWAEKWIANAMNTTPMDDADRDAMRVAMNGLYDAANLAPPERIVFCASPLSGAIAASVAAGVIYLREHPEKHHELFGRALSETGLMASLRQACARAVASGMGILRGEPALAAVMPAQAPRARYATAAATAAATYAATAAATYAATHAATDAATDAATRAATYAATRGATYAATDAATKFLLLCCQYFWRMRDGGSEWSAWPSYISFFRHVAKLDLPLYEKWQHYEAGAIHGGVRFVHAKFAIVCDRATTAKRDEQLRPHCEIGPARAWSDGWGIHFWHGTRVPGRWISERATLTAAEVLREQNSEVRRAGCEILGWTKILAELPHRILDTDADPMVGQLLSVDLPDSPGERFLRVKCGTGREFAQCVSKSCNTALEAQAWIWDWPVEVVAKRQVRT